MAVESMGAIIAGMGTIFEGVHALTLRTRRQTRKNWHNCSNRRTIATQTDHDVGVRVATDTRAPLLDATLGDASQQIQPNSS